LILWIFIVHNCWSCLVLFCFLSFRDWFGFLLYPTTVLPLNRVYYIYSGTPFVLFVPYIMWIFLYLRGFRTLLFSETDVIFDPIYQNFGSLHFFTFLIGAYFERAVTFIFPPFSKQASSSPSQSLCHLIQQTPPAWPCCFSLPCV
jgi:hypothetical protein